MHRYVLLVLLLAALVALPGCSKTKVVEVAVAPGGGTLTLRFDHALAGAPLALAGAYSGVDGAGNAFNVETLRYFVTNIRLYATDGRVIGLDDYHYRDASDATTRDYVLPGIPAGTYNAVSFTFGVDERWNAQGNAISADHRVHGMEWPPNWGGGWHYMILEGRYDPANGYGYRTHTGRRFIANAGDPSGQGPDTQPYHHHFSVYLPFASPIGVSADAWSTTITMELSGWYQNPAFDLAAFFPSGAGGIMVNLAAQDLLRRNGPACFSIAQPTRP